MPMKKARTTGNELSLRVIRAFKGMRYSLSRVCRRMFKGTQWHGHATESADVFSDFNTTAQKLGCQHNLS